MKETENYSTPKRSYPSLNITEKTIKNIKEHPSLFRGHVRTLMAKIYTTKEFEKRSDKVLGRRMP